MEYRDFDKIEGLLRNAAEWSPDTPAPEGLAARAMEAHLKRGKPAAPRSRRPSIAMFFAVLAGGSAATACLAGGLLAMFPAPASGPARVPESPPSAVASFTVPELPHPAHARVRRPSRTEFASFSRPSLPARVVSSPLVEPPELPDEEPRATLVSAPRRYSQAVPVRRRVRRAPARYQPPRAQWEVQVVNHEVTRAVAPGWLLATDQETGAVVAHPGVLSVPLTERYGACSEPQADPQCSSVPPTTPEEKN